jgi:6-pyruvoyltetrahydropterin/6-carboxytetrahydropterin synthase
MTTTYAIRISKEYITFAAAHFITYDGHQCEGLHGHNYRARVALDGPVDANHYVVDFSRIKKLMRELIEPLDHKVLLPLENPLVHVEATGGSVFARYKDRTYQFPRRDVALLPIPNTTAEMLARYLLGGVKKYLEQDGPRAVTSLEMEVEESFGQAGVCRELLRAAI